MNCELCQWDLADDEVGRVACRNCQIRLGSDLRELPGLYRMLGAALVPGGRADGPHVSGTKDVPLPVNENALELRAWGGMVTALEVHEEDWRRTLSLGAMARFRGSAEQALSTTVEFLAGLLWWACEKYPDIDGLAEDVRRLRGAALSVIAPPERTIRVGYCVTPTDDGGTCAAVLRYAPGSGLVRCPWCRSEFPPSSWLALAGSQTPVQEMAPPR